MNAKRRTGQIVKLLSGAISLLACQKHLKLLPVWHHAGGFSRLAGFNGGRHLFEICMLEEDDARSVTCFTLPCAAPSTLAPAPYLSLQLVVPSNAAVLLAPTHTLSL